MSISRNREDYFDFLRETSGILHPILLRIVETAAGAAPELWAPMMLIARRRLGQPLQKPALVRLSYEICGGKDWKQILPAAAAFELLNISSYHANASFDNKCGVLTKSDKDSQVIAAMLSRELASRAIQHLRGNFTTEILRDVDKAISLSNYNIYLAQHFDLNLLTTDRLSHYEKEDTFVEAYRRRCYLGSGFINGQCAFVGALLAGADARFADALRQFGEHFGTGLQVINDLADFVSPHIDPYVAGKCYQDSMSDLKNGRLTLPLYHLLKFSHQEAAEFVNNVIRNRRFDDTTLSRIVDLLLHEGSVTYTRRFALESATAAKSCLSLFPDTESRQHLMTMATILETNKYLAALDRRRADVTFEEVVLLQP